MDGILQDGKNIKQQRIGANNICTRHHKIKYKKMERCISKKM
jgi:hypothetical protein